MICVFKFQFRHMINMIYFQSTPLINSAVAGREIDRKWKDKNLERIVGENKHLSKFFKCSHFVQYIRLGDTSFNLLRKIKITIFFSPFED